MNEISQHQNIPYLSICEIANSHEKAISIELIHMNICNDLASALILSRLRYWFSPSKRTGQLRTHIRHLGKIWLARGNRDWYQECCVTERLIERIKIKLKALGLVECKVFKYQGMPTVHWRLIIQKYEELYNKIISNNVSICPDCGTHNNAEVGSVLPQNVVSSLYNNGLRHLPYTISLEDKDRVLRKAQLQADVSAQEALLTVDRNECFASAATTLSWLQSFGYKLKKAQFLMYTYSAYQLGAAKDYLFKQLKEKKTAKKSLTGYYIAILEKQWWLPNIKE